MSPNPTIPIPFGSRARAGRLARAVGLALPLLLSPAELSAAPFLRGDANGDSRLDLADALAILTHLYTGGAILDCPDAADLDDSGLLDVSDPVSLLSFLFLGGKPPAGPFPAAGPDPTPDPLGCRGETDLAAGDGLPPSPTDAADLASAARPPDSWTPAESSGDPIAVDGVLFDRLLSLRAGDRLADLAGAGAEEFLRRFRGDPPPAAAGGPPLAFTIRAPAGPDGCSGLTPRAIERARGAGGPEGGFLRGDLDGDGKVTADDAGLLSLCLSGKGPCPEICWDVADADDDGAVGTSDAGAIASAALEEGILSAPSGRCGLDPTPDPLGPCSARWCARGVWSLRMEPPEVCGLGQHPVELITIGRDGGEERERGLIELCDEPGEDCPPGPTWEPPAGETGATEGERCRWIVTTYLEPSDPESALRQTNYDGNGSPRDVRMSPPLASSGAMEVWRIDNGPGPDHALTATRMGARCSTPPTKIAFTRSGTLQTRVGLICLDDDGRLVGCDGEIEMEGIYRARVEMGTEEGETCPGSPNRVESLAEDQAELQLNSRLLFSKGASVQGGNQVTLTSNFSGELGLGGRGRGIAANAGIHFGVSQSSNQAGEMASDLLDAFALGRDSLPATISLQGKGRIGMEAYHRTWARARDRMTLGGYWFIARSPCLRDGPLFGMELLGEEAEKGLAREMASQFRKTRLGQ